MTFMLLTPTLRICHATHCINTRHSNALANMAKAYQYCLAGRFSQTIYKYTPSDNAIPEKNLSSVTNTLDTAGSQIVGAHEFLPS